MPTSGGKAGAGLPDEPPGEQHVRDPMNELLEVIRGKSLHREVVEESGRDASELSEEEIHVRDERA